MVLDLISALLITYGFYIGFSRGFVKTVVDTLSIIVALVVTMKFSPLVIKYLNEILTFNAGAEFIIGMLFTFFFTLLLFKFIGDKIEDLFKAVGLNFINQLAGGILLGVVFTMIIGGLLALATNFRILSEDAMAGSRLYGHLMQVNEQSSGILQTFKSIFSDFWNMFMDTMDKVKSGTEQKI
ncbi:MAG: CvpA family protein [Saprospiraceae bacterium]